MNSGFLNVQMNASTRLGGGVFKGTFGSEIIAAKTFHTLDDPESLKGSLKELINELNSTIQTLFVYVV
jgi:hypothetical protein